MTTPEERRAAALEEALVALVVLVGEQLDLDRLIAGLHRQYRVYETRSPEVAELLDRAGAALTQLAALREKRGTDPH